MAEAHEKVSEIKSREEKPRDIEPLRILVVEDNNAARNTLLGLLRLKGHEVWGAEDGEVALRKAAQVRPHLVIFDIGLPGINGMEAVRRMKKAAWSDKTSYVALSGWGQEENKKNALEAGFDSHLTKPASLEQLENLMRHASEKFHPKQQDT